ncbi:hypothetical protein ABI59_17485 [Acidobacteria bacterium Mor1]|nr:hypothetical protein ABI59_17485 [Acidobacteria bacterium Mor1]
MAALSLLILAAAALPAAAQVDPSSISGLQAWYRADSLGESHSEGDEIQSWPDRSSNGRDMQSDAKGLPAVYRVGRLNKHAVVQVRKGNGYAIDPPIDLIDHTIAVVYRAAANNRALFRSGGRIGMILRKDGNSDHFQPEGSGLRTVAYNTPVEFGDGYHLTLLGRRGSSLYSYVDGVDKGTGGKLDDMVGVSKFFELRHTQYSESDGNGLWIAEMLFYDRWLEESERSQLTAYLADRYGLGDSVEGSDVVMAGGSAGDSGGGAVYTTAATGGVMQLSSDQRIDVNGDGVAIPWNLQDLVEDPFVHDAEGAPTKLCSAADGVGVRLYASLPLFSSTPGVNIELGFRLEDGTPLRGPGRSGSFGGQGGDAYASVQAETFFSLNAGECVEVVAEGKGSPGTVKLQSSMAVVIVESR